MGFWRRRGGQSAARKMRAPIEPVRENGARKCSIGSEKVGAYSNLKMELGCVREFFERPNESEKVGWSWGLGRHH